MTAASSHRPTIAVTQHAISAGPYPAPTAGSDILQAGGNAIDAGCAAGIALGVLQSDLVGVAGVAPIMIYLADKEEGGTSAGLGPWPKALDPELFQREHGGKIPKGVLRTVVPAAPDAWITALRGYGTMSFSEVAGAAIRLAREGFPMYPLMAASLKRHEADHRAWPSTAAIFLPNGPPIPRLAFAGGTFPAEGAPAGSRRSLPANRSCRIVAIHGRRGTRRRPPQSQWARPRGRSGSRPRRLLSRRHRPQDRRFYEAGGRASLSRRSSGIYLAGCSVGVTHLFLSQTLY